jgi:hypothetical protein
MGEFEVAARLKGAISEAVSLCLQCPKRQVAAEFLFSGSDFAGQV